MRSNRRGDFVVDGIFSRETLLSLSKEKLQQQYPDKVRRIIYNNIKQWMEELLAAVFMNGQKKARNLRHLRKN